MRKRIIVITNSLFDVGRRGCLESGVVFCCKIKQFVCMFDVCEACSSLIRRRVPVGGPPFNVYWMLSRCFLVSFVVALFWTYGS